MTDPRARRPARPAATPSSSARARGRLTAMAAALAVGLVVTLAPGLAAAAPGATASGKFGTQGASGSTSAKKKGFKLPTRVAQGNAVSVLMPVQVGFAGYMPRVRIAVQYDRQIVKAHWVYVGIAALLDRGDYNNFRLPNCGLGDSAGSCNKGTVAGFDIYAGYAHKWYLEEYPYLVPIVRGAIGGGWWKYPDVGGSRQQSRDSSGTFSVRPGAGLRFFPIVDLGIGLDVNFAIGFTRSKDWPLAQPIEKNTGFLFGMEILPLIVEYRF
jgi:hypothetical protein